MSRKGDGVLVRWQDGVPEDGVCHCGAPGKRELDADATQSTGRPKYVYRCLEHAAPKW